MRASQTLAEPGISAWGWMIAILRLCFMLALLVVCVPLHYLWRLLRLGRFWPRVFLSGIGLTAGLEITIHGKARPGTLLLSNHVSWLDIPALAQGAGSAFVAHDGLAAIKPLKWLCDMNETVFVARHRRATVAEQAEQIREAIDNGGTLTLFPEGTTSDGTGMLPFKSALLSAVMPLPEGVTVQPVLLAYEDVPEMAWVGEEPGMDNFFRIIARLRPLRLAIHFLEPLHGAELADRKAMSAAAEARLRNAMTL